MNDKMTLSTLFVCSIFCTVGLFAQSNVPFYQAGTAKKVIDLKIGENAKDDNYMFAGIARIVVDSAGDIYVLDYQESHIKKFSPEGVFIKTFSGPGQGPGEILRCFKMVLLPGNNIVTLDGANNRFTIFNSEGELQQTVAYTKLISRRDYPFFMESDPLGNIYIETRNLAMGDKKGDLHKIWQITDNLATARCVDSCYVKDNEYIHKGNTLSNQPIPFAPGIIWAIGANGNLVTGRTGAYEIRIYSPDRQLIKTFTHKIKPKKVTTAEKEAFFGGLVYNDGSGTIKQGASAEMRKNTHFPSHMPFIQSVSVDQEGYILCRTYESDDKNYFYDIFDPNGVFINRASLPSIQMNAHGENGFFYGTHQTESGEPTVIKYHLE